MRQFGGDFGRARLPPEEPGDVPAARRFLPVLYWTAAIVVSLGVLVYLTYRDMQAERKLATIRAALEEYATGIEGLEGRYELTRRPEATGGSNVAAPLDGNTSTVEFAMDWKNHRWASESFTAPDRTGLFR